MVKFFGSITEARQIFAQRYYDIWASLLGICDALQLVQPLPACFIVAGYYYLLLLHGERQMTKLRVLPLEDGSVEAVIILPMVSPTYYMVALECLGGIQNV